MSDSQGVVYLVGAGPGDPGLLTCRGLECLRRAQVLIYDGLVSPEVVSLAPSSCERIYAGKKKSQQGGALSQEHINTLLVERASAGKRVVRLKGGDPFVFGRGAEECMALLAAEIRFEVVPGVSAATAVAAYAGIPLTARGISASAVLVTGHEAEGKEQGAVNWAAVAGSQTIVLFMAWKKIADCSRALLDAGRPPDTPAAAIRWGTTAAQQTLTTTLAKLPEEIDRAGLRPPVLVVIGDVVGLRDDLAWVERRPLFGKRILVTRAGDRAHDIVTALRDLGARPVVAAPTQIKDSSERNRRDLASALAALSTYDWIFLTSANSVQACRTLLTDLGLDSRALGGVKIAAVGAATCTALARSGLRADLTGHRDGKSLASALVQATEGRPRVLFPRAHDGRDEPVSILQEAGMQVEVISAYQSQVVSASEPKMALALSQLRAGELEGAVFFAPSQVRALCELDAEAPRHLAGLEVLGAIGRTTAAALQELGLTVHAIPERPTSRLLVDALVQAFS